jgi:hypothetical protein
VKESTYGLELLVSREFSRLTPYVGVSGYLASARETTPKVSLENENAFGVQANVGITASLSVVRLGAGFNLAKVSGMSMKVAIGL